MVDSGREGPAKGARDVANLDERVTTLEAQANNHTRAIDGVRTEIGGLRAEITELRGELRTSVAQVRGEMATRSDIAELRVATRSDVAELRREMVHRLDLMDAKIDRLFMWMVGLMVSGFFVVIGGLVGVAFR